MRPICWLGLLALLAASACAAPGDPMDTQMQCIQDPECRARLQQRH
jgi:hypothetical protein